MSGPRRRRNLLAVVVGVGALLVGMGAFVAHGETNDGGGPGSRKGSHSPGAARAPAYGASFQLHAGESYADALARTDQTLGKLSVVRVFYPGAPDPWPGKAPGRDVVVSFKLDPSEVVTGRYDSQMKAWFSAAPQGVDVWWCLWHEPEDDVASGSFTAAQFAAAFERLDRLADEARNSRLHSTVILQSYSMRAGSGRDWRSYLPDPSSIDVLAWDVYNRVRRVGGYASPEELLDGPREASESMHVPFAIAELGSALAPGDDGSGRASWLRSMGDYLARHHAVFVTYFDFSWHGGRDDYRLQDADSVRAWKAISHHP